MSGSLKRDNRVHAMGDEDEETKPITAPDSEVDDSLVLGEYIALQNNYNSMNTSPRAPMSVSSDGLEDDRDDHSEHTSDQNTSTTDVSIDADLLDLARDGQARRLKVLLDELRQKYANNLTKFEAARDRRNKYGYSALHLAARYNRKNCVKHLLVAGMNINEGDGEDKNTPLLLSAKYDKVDVLRVLLKREADTAVKNKYGTTALHFAARRGNLEACRLLLDMPGVDVNNADNAEQTPLHMAMLGGDKHVTKLLIDRGADVHVKDIEGEGPIHLAAGEDVPELILTLVHGVVKGYDKGTPERASVQRNYVNQASHENDTALHLASQAGYLDTVKTLVHIGADVNLATDTKATPLHLAAISGQLEVVKFLVRYRAKINALDDEQMTPVHRACQYGRLDVVKFLRTQNARMDTKDRDSYSPLMCAVWKGRNHVAEYLLENGSKMHQADSSGKTVLHIAVEEDHEDTLELLLSRPEADELIDTVDKESKTALHYAAISGNKKSINLLVGKNATLDLDDREDMTPIHYAAKLGHLACVNALMKKSAGSVIHCTDKKGRSPLHHAAINGHFDVCEALINKGAETSCRDDIQWTPLDYAAMNGHPKTIELLLDNDADVDAVDKNNNTPLHHASKEGNVDSIRILLDNGASISLRNKDELNCLDIAAENFNKDACLALVEHPRWMEALQSVEKDNKARNKSMRSEDTQSETASVNEDKNDQYPLEKLIEVAPDVAHAVLDKCVTVSELAPTHENYCISYDFDLLDKLPKRGYGTKYFAPDTMVKFKRERLLAHPLVVKLVRHKWGKLGRWIIFVNNLMYFVFILLLTALVLADKEHAADLRKAGKKASCQKDNSTRGVFTDVVPWVTIAFACVQVLKELIQMMVQREKYFKEFVNILEFCLYITTILFLLPFLLCYTGRDGASQEELKWTAGAIAILLGWIDFLMHLTHLPIFGLYVAMFSEVMQSLVSVLAVFSILIIAFALSFFSLIDVQDDFQNPGVSIVSTMVKMIGELEYDGIFTDSFSDKSKLPYKGMTMTIFIIFVAAMTIVVMNLLVGLAVGDIESVRKTAFLRILKDEVKALKLIERNMPMFVLRKIHDKNITDYPNQRGFFRRWIEWLNDLDSEAMMEEQTESAGLEENVREEVTLQKNQLVKQKQKMKNLVAMIETQRNKYKKMARNLGVLDE